MWIVKQGGRGTRRNELLSESERMLVGTPEGNETGNRLPAWIPLSSLVHADYAWVTSYAVNCKRSLTENGHEWFVRLAAEVLGACESESVLSRVQREVLVPLQLQLLDERVADPKTPDDLIALVRSRLQAYQLPRAA